ncbi:SDR family NAD(P)-dependent oxidoreductase [Streptomyces coeruleoprunus]|uniref:SDR family NAD(P)-dependent oxidoreductase n=1 Tax=Streptomyces coeruleoprunus TaxID=285563 RepID=A0ABV9XHT8_9ACTN
MTESPTFTETFTVTADNPLLHGHVVYGRSLMPGVGYVDLVLQVLARHGHPMPDVELRNLTILAPLVAGPGEQVLTTVEGRPAPLGGWRIEVRSRRPQDTADVVHAVVSAHRRAPSAFTERLPLPVEGATRRTTLDEIYTWCREIDLFHSGLMKIGGVVHHRPGDWIAELELAPEHQGSTAAFLFHPALFEAGLLGGGVALGMLHGDNDGPGLYLPLMFERFRAAAPLGKRCYVRVPADSVRRDDELIRLVVEFYDATGQKVAEVGRFVAKRIRAAGALDVRDEPTPVVTAAAPVAAPSAGASDLVDVVRGLVAARLEVPADRVDVGLGYYELGLASADLLSLVAELEERLSVELSPTVMFEHKTIADLAAWLETSLPERPVPAPVVEAAPVADLVGVVRGLVAARLEVPADRVDVGLGYYELGLASADLLSLVAELEERLSVELSPTVMFEHKTIADLAAWLETSLPERPTPAPVVEAAPAPVVVAPRPGADDELLAAVRTALTDEVAALLRVPAAEVHADGEFVEFGFDVNALAHLADRIDDRYGLTLPPAVLADHRTVQTLAAHLVGAHRDHVAQEATGASATSTLAVAGVAPAASVAPAAPAVPPPAPAPAAPAVPGSASPDRLHPMLHRVVPSADGDTATYETHFTGDEPFLRDHQVRGGRVLPGVAHLEMARAAAARTLGAGEGGALRLADVVWLRPALCGPDGLDLRVSVRTAPTGGCTYEIHSVDAHGTATLCSQGRASLPDGTPHQTYLLDELRAACGGAVHSAAHVYGLYTGMGMEYGPSQRALTELRTGTDPEGRPQVLARLRLPAEADAPGGGLMHPSILDGALQATIGLWLTGDGSGDRSAGLALPFALERAEAAAATPTTAYAWIRHRPGTGTDTASARLDVTVLDERGRVRVDLTGLSTRLLPTTDTGQDTPPEPAPAAAPLVAEPARSGDIAIIGVSGRYPEAADLDEFWRNLRSGRDCIREVPADRWDHRRYTNDGGPGAWGGFLDDIDRFDPLFFQISLLEADHLDPQERLFLQCAHHTLEDAGYTSDRLSRGGKVGVFVGVMYQEYQLHGAQAQERGLPVALWGSASTVANRVSYFYDFHGPSMAVDTMCSSSLTAIHLACEAIRSGQCGTALAGGVNLTPHPNKYLVLGQRKFLSSDGRCRSFGEGGDGYVPGEGVGAVLLKPLEQAVADGDHIHGVIKGTAVNHGGRTTGYSVPTPVAQGEVIADALTAAGVDPRSLSYLEAHGTGTSLGDPIEIAGLEKAFRRAGGAPERCAIGSVKSNIGHGESAAGIAAVTKVLLQMRHGELVPSLHSGTLNPHIDFDRTPLRVQRRLEPWHRPTSDADGERRTLPRIAGVSSFGGGGSNAHVVIAEYQAPAPPARRPANGRPALLVLSARSEEQLVEQARRLSARLAELTDDDLPAVAWTLQTGRMALEERLALAVTSVADARALLDAFAAAPGRAGRWTRGTVRPDRPADAPAALRTALSDWTERGAHDRLLGLWADGAVVDWEAARPAGTPVRRIGLPGYPFARERCWLDLDAGEAPPAPVATAAGADGAEMMLLRPVWTPEDAAGAVRAASGTPFAERHVVVVGRLADADRDALRAALPAGSECTFLEPADGPLDHGYTEAVRQLFTLTRGLLERGVRRPALLQVALVGSAGDDAERDRLACFGGLAGLLRTARLENPNLHTQYVECLDGASPATVAARLAAEAAPEPEPEVRHRGGRRLVGRLQELTSARPAATPWREDGVYLVTGGTGGLGLIVARDIAASVAHATVVLTGRSPLDEEKRGALGALRAAGLTVDYQRADVADRDAVARLLDHVLDNHGPLTGVLHAAGVIDDNFVVRKSPEELERVLAPKVAGLAHLDELTRQQPLDVFVCFSSIGGAFGNPGQCDYAAANAFMDAYAVHRNRLVDAGLRRGRTVSVNWPLWDEGGMGADGPARDQLSALGLAPLDTPRGLTALRCALAADANGLTDGRLLVVAGRRDTLLPRLTGRGEPAAGQAAPATAGATPAPAAEAAPAAAPATGASATRALEDRAVGHLRRVLAPVLKLGAERLDPDTPLERYGMDSVLAVGMVQPLEESFGPLSRTLLFEVQTVRGLARYLAADHTDALRALVGEPTPAPAPAPSPVSTPAPAVPTPRGHERGDDRNAQDVAIIGISGRYPQAADLDAFWDGLRDGRDCVTPVPAERWDTSAAGHPQWGAFLDGIDRFDPLHFGISPREAAAMDPQQRLFLETVWHLLEQSGITQEVVEQRYGRRVGVYVGAAYQMYRADQSDPTLAALTSAASYNLIANRVSHFFGLEGPSLAVDSMCTSSAMAVHLACADLLRGESELAVAGGVNLTVHPDKYVALSEMQLLGTHPGSRSFRDGDGYLPAEAVGAVLLKPLDAALRDGDTVHAVIKATSSLHGGRSNGFMTPSHRTQVAAMRRALDRAGAEPGSIGYVEAAANGTTFTDEVELRALREVFGGVTAPVPVGTVKSNLGHPEAASGIAQLTKVVLQLRHGRIAPLVEAGDPNPNLAADGSPVVLCDELTAWEPRATADGSPAPRRALINSVAAGGSHVSLVVEAPPRTAEPRPQDTGATAPQLVAVSARTPERLITAVRRLHDHLEGLEGDDTVGLADIAYTSQLGREALPERLAVVASSRDELKRALAHHLADGDRPAGPAGSVHRGNADEDAGPLATVLSGARGEAFLAGLVEDGDLDQLAELWVRGVRVPWSGLHDGRRRLVPLPATAFAPGSYWVGRTPETRTPEARAPEARVPAARTPEPRTPESRASLTDDDPTLTDAERTVRDAWSDVLQIDTGQLGAKSDFFSLGGNSLLATRLINLLKEQTGAELPVETVFNAPRLADMATELEQRLPLGVARDATTRELELILDSIGLVERMSDAELDALDTEN